MNERTTKRKKNDATDDKAIDLLEKACSQLESTSKANKVDKPDDCHLFGLHVAETLRQITNMWQRGLCKLKIQELLFKFQFESPAYQETYEHQFSAPAQSYQPTYTPL